MPLFEPELMGAAFALLTAGLLVLRTKRDRVRIDLRR
jgi:hypothetical protein